MQKYNYDKLCCVNMVYGGQVWEPFSSQFSLTADIQTSGVQGESWIQP